MLYLCGLNTNQFLRMKPLTFILLLLTLLLPTTADAQQRDRLAELNVACLNEHTLQSGDLIFCKGWSEMDKAITASTGEYTHVALVERDSADNAWIIEALPEKGVLRRSFREFERRFSMLSTFDVYRLTQPFDTAAVIARAKSLVGKPYDEAFLPDNDAYYCSELIEVVFDGLFPSKPMNWRDAKGKLPAYWKKHFEKLGVPVPEGVPGTNPTDLSRTPILKKL